MQKAKIVSIACRPSGSLPLTCSARLSFAGAISAGCGQGAALAGVRPRGELRLHATGDLVLGRDERRVPGKARLVAAARLVQRVAEMLLDFRLVGILLRRRCSVAIASSTLPRLNCAQPSESVIDASSGRKLARLADHRFGSIDILAPLELRVAEEVEQQRLVGRDGQRLLQRRFRFGPAVRLLERARLQQQQRPELVLRVPARGPARPRVRRRRRLRRGASSPR